MFLGEPNINVHIAVISSIALAAVLAWTMARLLKVPWGSADSIGMVMLALILPPPMLVVAMMASGVIAIVTILIFKRRVLKGQATGHSFTVPVVTVFAAGLGVALTVGMWLNYI